MEKIEQAIMREAEQRLHRNNRSIGLLLFLFLVIVVGGLAWGWWQKAQTPVSSQPNKEVFIVKQGMSANAVGEELKNKNLIRSAQAFNIMARFKKVDVQLKAGSYILSPSMNLAEIIRELLKGPKAEIIKVTIPEGYTTDQIMTLLVDKGLGTKEEFLSTIADEQYDYSFLKYIPKDINKRNRLEGFLFPDTYFFDQKSTPHQVINSLLQRFGKEVTPEVENKLTKENRSIFDWVTLASLVEKEAVKEVDRPLIAGVFINRLKRGMLLQSDATIQYILGLHRSVVYYKDLKIPSPYNTYLNTGLPLGPIANPGHASLDAALNPASTDYLYFVAKSDGFHIFAKTYKEQLHNQELYQAPETLPK